MSSEVEPSPISERALVIRSFSVSAREMPSEQMRRFSSQAHHERPLSGSVTS